MIIKDMKYKSKYQDNDRFVLRERVLSQLNIKIIKEIDIYEHNSFLEKTLSLFAYNKEVEFKEVIDIEVKLSGSYSPQDMQEALNQNQRTKLLAEPKSNKDHTDYHAEAVRKGWIPSDDELDELKDKIEYEDDVGLDKLRGLLSTYNRLKWIGKREFGRKYSEIKHSNIYKKLLFDEESSTYVEPFHTLPSRVYLKEMEAFLDKDLSREYIKHIPFDEVDYFICYTKNVKEAWKNEMLNEMSKKKTKDLDDIFLTDKDGKKSFDEIFPNQANEIESDCIFFSSDNDDMEF